MALQFEVETLDGVNEAHRALYAEHGGKFRLQVDGVDPADELKIALQKEREDRKREAEEKQRIKEEAERLAAEAERERLETEGKHQEAAEMWKAEAEQLKAKAAAAEADRINEKLDNQAQALASANANTAQDAKLLARFIRDELEYGDSGVAGKNGRTVEQVIESMERSGEYKSLWRGSSASGAGATGGTSSAQGKALSDMNDAERIEFKNRDPAGFAAAIKGK